MYADGRESWRELQGIVDSLTDRSRSEEAI